MQSKLGKMTNFHHGAFQHQLRHQGMEQRKSLEEASKSLPIRLTQEQKKQKLLQEVQGLEFNLMEDVIKEQVQKEQESKEGNDEGEERKSPKKERE